MDPLAAEVADDPPRGLGTRVAEELAADYDPRFARPLHFTHESAPHPDRRRLRPVDRLRPAGHGEDREGRLRRRAGVVDPLPADGVATGVEGGLERRGPRLERADMDEPRTGRDEERVSRSAGRR